MGDNAAEIARLAAELAVAAHWYMLTWEGLVRLTGSQEAAYKALQAQLEQQAKEDKAMAGKPIPKAEDVHGRVDAGWIYGELLELLSLPQEVLRVKIAFLAGDVLHEVEADAEEASPEFKAEILAALHDDGPTRIIEPEPEARGISQQEASDVD